MLFKNKVKCKSCLFSWGVIHSQEFPLCEYYCITNLNRQNTAQECYSYIKRPKADMSETEKYKYYREIIKNDREKI